MVNELNAARLGESDSDDDEDSVLILLLIDFLGVLLGVLKTKLALSILQELSFDSNVFATGDEESFETSKSSKIEDVLCFCTHLCTGDFLRIVFVVNSA